MASPGEQRMEQWFPNLKAGGYEMKSGEDPVYNCVAWALGRTDAWWEPVQKAGYYWPEGAPLDDRTSSLVHVFKLEGFEECESDRREEGVEKVAIYGDDDSYLHAARQTPEGKWTSKIGPFEDIEHDSLLGLVGTDYGAVVKILSKPKAASEVEGRGSGSTSVR